MWFLTWIKQYTHLFILINSFVLVGLWMEPDMQYVLCFPLICPRVTNSDHYQVPSTMSPTLQLDISNRISFQTQHMQIKLHILLPKWDILQILGQKYFSKHLGLELLRYLNLIINPHINFYSLAIPTHCSTNCYLVFCLSV
jgi:hypothetical protein